MARQPRVGRRRAAARLGLGPARAHDGRRASAHARARARAAARPRAHRARRPGRDRRARRSRCSATRWLQPGLRGHRHPVRDRLPARLHRRSGSSAATSPRCSACRFYARRRIGARRWRTLHRATVVVYALGLVHALGAGTDAGDAWLRALMLATLVPIGRPVRPARRRAPARAARRPAADGGLRLTARSPEGARHDAASSSSAAASPPSAAPRRCAPAATTARSRMVCGETRPPYDRPPLSKAVLAGELPGARACAPDGWYAAQRRRAARSATRPRRLDARPSPGRAGRRRAARLRPAADRHRRAPRTLPALSRAARTSRSCARSTTRCGCAPRCAPGARLAVVGAGLIGQEVARPRRARAGAHVTLIDAAPAPFDALVGSALARWLASLHARRRRRSCDSARGWRQSWATSGRERSVLADGARDRCDHVLVGGRRPARHRLARARLERGPRAGHCRGRLRRRRRRPRPLTGAIAAGPLGGRRPPGRGRRAGDARHCRPRRRRCRSSGATSTASASSASATRAAPTVPSSTATWPHATSPSPITAPDARSPPCWSAAPTPSPPSGGA